MGPTPLIEKPRKHRLIYSDREQSRGCLRAGRGDGLQRGRRKLIEGHARYFHRSGGSSGTCETHQTAHVVRQLYPRKAATHTTGTALTVSRALRVLRDRAWVSLG